MCKFWDCRNLSWFIHLFLSWRDSNHCFVLKKFHLQVCFFHLRYTILLSRHCRGKVFPRQRDKKRKRYILGVPVRAQKHWYVDYNIFRSHQNRTSRTKVMKNQKLGPIWPFWCLFLEAISEERFSRFWIFFENFSKIFNFQISTKWPNEPVGS